MRKRNKLVDGLLLIMLGILLSCTTMLCYPLLSIAEVLTLHPYGSWGIPIILIILGFVLLEIHREEKKYDE